MKTSVRNRGGASRATAFVGGVAAALAAVILVVAVGMGSASAAPQVARNGGMGSAVAGTAVSCIDGCMQSACSGFRDSDGDGVCDRWQEGQGVQRRGVIAETAVPQDSAQSLGACRNDADGDGVCDACGSSTPAACDGVCLYHDRFAQGPGGNGTGNAHRAYHHGW